MYYIISSSIAYWLRYNNVCHWLPHIAAGDFENVGVPDKSSWEAFKWQTLMTIALQWRHYELDDVSNHQCLRCLLYCWSRRRSKKTSKLRVTGLCAGNSPVNSPHKSSLTRKMLPFDDAILMLAFWIHLVEKRSSGKRWWQLDDAKTNLPFSYHTVAYAIPVVALFKFVL